MVSGGYIEVADLSLAYPGRGTLRARMPVLEGVCLNVPKGDFFTIVGPNGCGKTTLLSCLAGVLSPSAGSVRIGGKPPSRSTCGFVFQNYRESLYPWLSVLDNIAMPLWLNGTPRNSARKAAVELLAKFRLDLPLDRYPYTLSGGQQQLTALLRSVIHEPDVLLMDEPMGSLDVTCRSELRDMVQRIWQATGATTVLVTHDLDEAVLLADVVVALSPRPSRVVGTVAVDLPRPRGSDLLRDHRFVECKEKLRDVLAIGQTI